MQLTLNVTERAIVLKALDNYRRQKGAEGKLTAHKEKTPDDIKTVQASYDTLLSRVAALHKRIEVLK